MKTAKLLIAVVIVAAGVVGWLFHMRTVIDCWRTYGGAGNCERLLS